MKTRRQPMCEFLQRRCARGIASRLGPGARRSRVALNFRRVASAARGAVQRDWRVLLSVHPHLSLHVRQHVLQTENPARTLLVARPDGRSLRFERISTTSIAGPQSLGLAGTRLARHARPSAANATQSATGSARKRSALTYRARGRASRLLDAPPDRLHRLRREQVRTLLVHRRASEADSAGNTARPARPVRVAPCDRRPLRVARVAAATMAGSHSVGIASAPGSRHVRAYTAIATQSVMGAAPKRVALTHRSRSSASLSPAAPLDHKHQRSQGQLRAQLAPRSTPEADFAGNTAQPARRLRTALTWRAARARSKTRQNRGPAAAFSSCGATRVPLVVCRVGTPQVTEIDTNPASSACWASEQRRMPLVARRARRPQVTDVATEPAAPARWTSERRRVALVWRKHAAESTSALAAPMALAGVSNPAPTAHPAAPVSDLPRASQLMRSPKPAFDAATVDRLTDDVIRKIERRVRIERERQGL